MLEALLDALDKSNEGPVTKNFMDRVRNLKQKAEQLGIRLTPPQVLSSQPIKGLEQSQAARTFLIRTLTEPMYHDDPYNYFYKFEGDLDPLGTRRYRSHILHAIKLRQALQDDPNNELNAWNYKHTLEIIKRRSPPLYAKERMDNVVQAEIEIERYASTQPKRLEKN